MQQIISTQDLTATQQHAYEFHQNKKANILNRFIDWCNGQEERRYLWLAIALLGSIGMVLPLTLLAILFASGNNFTLWILACALNVPVLAINLAAQPTKYTLPTMFFAWAINAVIIIYSLAVFFMA